MTIERYQKDYVYDDAEMETGFKLSNSWYDGDTDFSGFKCTECRHVDFLLADTEIEFGREIDCAAMRYVYDSFEKFLNGEKSDWKVTSVCVEPAHLQFQLRNEKLEHINYIATYGLDCEVESMADYAEVPGAMKLEFFDDIFGSARAFVDVFNYDSHGRCLELRQKRWSVTGKKEIDYYKVTFGKNDYGAEYAKIEEWHKKNPERRTIDLRWANGEDGELNRRHMLGEIVEFR